MVMNDLPTGTLLNNKYIVRSCIGKGGLGTVYLCLDKSSGKDVTVKEISFRREYGLLHDADISDNSQYSAIAKDERLPGNAGQKEKFNLKKEVIIPELELLEEFKDDPDFLTVYDSFEENENLYLVMEFLDGESLRTLIRNGVIFEDKEIREVGLLVLRPLKKLHNRNLLHYDICPDNIMIGNDIRVKLIDYDGFDSFPNKIKHMRMFRNGYSAPEACIAYGTIGVWTEVYSLGATLYEMATGNRIPTAEERIKNDTVVPPREINPEISAGLSDTIMKAISLIPKRRFQTDIQFEKALIREDTINARISRWVMICIAFFTVLVTILQLYFR